MNWKKKGLIFKVAGNHSWNKTHAQLPIVDTSDANKWRIYYATRDSQGKSRTSYIDTEVGNPLNIIYVHNQPILNLGASGTFDENGIMPVAIVNSGKNKSLYYAGWGNDENLPYHNTIGLAQSKDNGENWEKFGDHPILGATLSEPHSTGTINILKKHDYWYAYYQSVIAWEVLEGRLEPIYHLKYAESEDGISWEREGKVAINFKDKDEGGICGASVLKDEKVFKMWYSYRKKSGYRNNRNNSYRIGYAESIDGKDWQRLDERVGIDIADRGWDSEMMAYPNVVKHNNTYFMFYNGNGFGASGIGYAINK